jgi:hypothetical protein
MKNNAKLSGMNLNALVQTWNEKICQKELIQILGMNSHVAQVVGAWFI